MTPMPMYAILRFQKCKAGGVACRDRHNERKKVEYKSNPNIDLTRSKDNYHLIDPQGIGIRIATTDKTKAHFS